jgi:uncharacterized repeat protein (TIGR03803 family)
LATFEEEHTMRKWDGGARIFATLLAWTALALASQAQTFTTLFTFNTNNPFPVGALTQARDGFLYGTTSEGGAGGQSGTVFKITAAGVLTQVASFDLNNGAAPESGLIQATDGNFYGTTLLGGSANNGTVFKMTPEGAITLLYSFCPVGFLCHDGIDPSAGLVQGIDGKLYGGTDQFGFDNCPDGDGSGCGTTFSITTNGDFKRLDLFKGRDGASLAASLVQSSDGNFYGTTIGGGITDHGTVFKMTPSGTLATLYNFCSQKGCTDGADPSGGLVQGADGNFYGTTQLGGFASCYQNTGCGTFFKITPSGVLTTLHRFCGACGEGAFPTAAPIQATDGNFYGTTTYFASGNAGVLFKMTPAGALTVLHVFCLTPCTDGSRPISPLVQDTNGDFYGTATSGGALDSGTLFRLSNGLAQFVRSNPTMGSVGEDVMILGTDLTGASRVTFNGTAADFKVVSPTLISASVPSGATTGTIEVTLPVGTLSSNPVFTVVP